MLRILVLNLGGTSTKVAIFEDREMVLETNIHHPRELSRQFQLAVEQISYRKEVILDWLKKRNLTIDDFDCFALRGGSLDHTQKGGTYRVNSIAVEECKRKIEEHPKFYHGTQIVILLALALADGRKLPIFITDPPNVNELVPEAKISGHPTFERVPVFHVLNTKAVGRKLMSEQNKVYEETKLVICHMGAGVSISAHHDGRIIDANNCMNGEGPMSANRVGQLPMKQLIQRCFDPDWTEEEILRLIRQEGGVKAHLGTSDMRKVETMVKEKDQKAQLIVDAFVWQIAKSIGSYCAVLNGEADYIILTGGIAHSQLITNKIIQKVNKLAPVLIFPGELESEGLAMGAWRAITGEIKAMDYQQPAPESVLV